MRSTAYLVMYEVVFGEWLPGGQVAVCAPCDTAQVVDIQVVGIYLGPVQGGSSLPYFPSVFTHTTMGVDGGSGINDMFGEVITYFPPYATVAASALFRSTALICE